MHVFIITDFIFLNAHEKTLYFGEFCGVLILYIPVHIGYTYIFQEYEETCLFTIARFSASKSLRVYPNIYKNSPPFASREGFPLVGIAMSVRERESASDSIILSLLA